jgi:hypothetical protein
MDFVAKLSIFVQNYTAFIVLMAAVAVLKLVLVANTPASFDLQAIMMHPTFPNSPWGLLENHMFELWKLATSSAATDPAEWVHASPTEISLEFRLLSMLLRLPAFFADVALSCVLYLVTMKMTQSTELSRLSSLIWFLNPYNFFAAELLGVPDVTVALLTVVSVLFLLYKRFIPASITLSFAVALKLYPILLVPPIAVYIARTNESHPWRRLIPLITLSVVGILGYLAWLYPYSVAVLSSDYTPVSQPLNLFIVAFTLGQGGTVSMTMVALVLTYLLILTLQKSGLVSTIALTLLAYYLFSNPYPQYFIWVFPFLTLDIVLFKRNRAVLFSLFVIFIFAYWAIVSHAFSTPSNYSLFLIPITQPLMDFMNSSVTKTLLLPLFNAGLYASILIYAIDIVRDALRNKGNVIVEAKF